MAKVSILLPVYNSISRNGDGYLQQALDSLIHQTFTDIEIHILDNISIDDTPKICQEYAKQDERVKFKVDTKQRFPEDGINKLAEGINSEYVMVANCDDLWNHYYIEHLIEIIDSKPNIDLVYSNGSFIDQDDNIGNSLISDTDISYTHEPDENFCIAIQYRNVIPILFGIFRTEAYKRTLPYQTFDTLKANVDNLFLAKFFLNGFKAQLYDRPLFHYRDRCRKLQPKSIEGMPKNPILIWVYYIKHQLNFYRAVERYIPDDKPLLKIITIDSCMRHITYLLGWVERDLVKDQFERSVIEILHKKYKVIYSLLLKESYPQPTEQLYNDSYRKCELLKKSILEYIRKIMNPNEVIDSTIKLVEEIQEEIKR